MFLESQQLPRHYSKNKFASAQFHRCVTTARPVAAASTFRPSFLTPREKLRLIACGGFLDFWVLPFPLAYSLRLGSYADRKVFSSLYPLLARFPRTGIRIRQK